VSKIVLFMFAGREENMTVQWPYLERLLTDYPNMELHLWDLTRRASDARYLRDLTRRSLRVKVLDHLHTGHPIRCRYPNGRRRLRGHPPCTCMIHKPPYEKPYQWYAGQPEYADAVFVKIDDDVLFLETERFDDLIAPLADHPNRIVSANVINNVVCAKYSDHNMLLANRFEVGDPRDPRNDKRWWWLHTNEEFAKSCHEIFLSIWEDVVDTNETPAYVRSRPGEAVSINCIAFTHQTMKTLAAAFKHSPRLGDEGVVDQHLPWICKTFHAAHLTFGPQDKEMTTVELNDLREQYAQLAKEYL
jgi:hypothetical protein